MTWIRCETCGAEGEVLIIAPEHVACPECGAGVVVSEIVDSALERLAADMRLPFTLDEQELRARRAGKLAELAVLSIGAAARGEVVEIYTTEAAIDELERRLRDTAKLLREILTPPPSSLAITLIIADGGAPEPRRRKLTLP